jgi:hypothetical protein
MEALFAAAVVLFALLLLKDALHLLLWAGRLAGPRGPCPFPGPPWAGGLWRGPGPGRLGRLAGYAGARGTHGGDRRARPAPGLDGLSVVQLRTCTWAPSWAATGCHAVVERTNALRPDLVALTGDMVDGLTAQLGGTMAPGRPGAAHGVIRHQRQP